MFKLRTKSKKRTGLVLSGGGTKGIAHAGVLKFLEEKHIRPDVIAGASAGSIVAALYGIDKSPKEILEFFESVSFFKWKHFVFNRPGFINSAAFVPYFTPLFGDTRIGDLALDVKIVSTDLVSGATRIFDKQTRVIDAVIASSALPGITTPYPLNEVLYSDGGILNNFPADLIRAQCDPLIGVYVSPQQVYTRDQLDSIRSITVRAYELLAYRTEQPKFAQCDWLICPEDLAHYNTFESKKNRMEEIFNIGYQAASESFSYTLFEKRKRH